MISIDFNSYASMYFYHSCFVFEHETVYTIRVLAVFDF